MCGARRVRDGGAFGVHAGLVPRGRGRDGHEGALLAVRHVPAVPAGVSGAGDADFHVQPGRGVYRAHDGGVVAVELWAGCIAAEGEAGERGAVGEDFF